MNRAFKYGDGLFETMKVVNGYPLFWKDHFARLLFGAKLLHLEFKESWLEETLLSAIDGDTSDYTTCRVRVTIYRSGKGKYTPETNAIKWSLEATPLSDDPYTLPEEGISLGIYDDTFVSCQPLSNAKTLNALPYVLASHYKQKVGWDDVVIKNSEGRIAEASSSNIFIQYDNRIITPPLSEGCIDGVFRKQLVKKLSPSEEVIQLGMLQETDSIFITNVISGIRWVNKLSIHDKPLSRPGFLERTLEDLF